MSLVPFHYVSDRLEIDEANVELDMVHCLIPVLCVTVTSLIELTVCSNFEYPHLCLVIKWFKRE